MDADVVPVAARESEEDPAGVTADETPGHDPDRAVRDAQREQERAASRARQQAAYQRAQRASRRRAVLAAGEDLRPLGTRSPQGDPSRRAPRAGQVGVAEDPHDRPPTDLTAVELAQQRLEEAELQRALLAALAALPADQRVAVVAALGYAEGPAGAAVELGVDPAEAEQLTRHGLDALQQALGPFRTRDE